MTQYLIRDQQGGKTTELVMWVCRGQRIDGYPDWSRGLVVPDNRQFEYVLATFRDADRYLRNERGFAPGLSKVLFVWDDVYSSHGFQAESRFSHQFRLAIDNAHHILESMMGVSAHRLELVSLDGTLYDPDADIQGGNDIPEGPRALPESFSPKDKAVYERFDALRAPVNPDRVSERRRPRNI